MQTVEPRYNTIYWVPQNNPQYNSNLCLKINIVNADIFVIIRYLEDLCPMASHKKYTRNTANTAIVKGVISRFDCNIIHVQYNKCINTKIVSRNAFRYMT